MEPEKAEILHGYFLGPKTGLGQDLLEQDRKFEICWPQDRTKSCADPCSQPPNRNFIRFESRVQVEIVRFQTHARNVFDLYSVPAPKY